MVWGKHLCLTAKKYLVQNKPVQLAGWDSKTMDK